MNAYYVITAIRQPAYPGDCAAWLTDDEIDAVPMYVAAFWRTLA